MAIKKVKIDPRALKLKSVREELRELQKAADGLKADLVKDYGLGVHPGFVIIEKSRSILDQELLAEKLGDLDPFRTDTPSIYLEFPKTAA